MKFTVNRAAFIKELNDVSRAIASRTTIPVLTGLKLVVDQDGITLTGSDSDISIETTLSIADEAAALNIDQPGAIVLPARFFIDIVKQLPAQAMTLEMTTGFQTKITSGSASFTINGLDANTYPNLPEIEATNSVTLSAETLREIISETVIAVSNQESRPILTGVHFSLNNNEFLAVATDSHRLAQRKVALEDTLAATADVIIPGKSLNELAKMLESVETVEMRIAENQVLFILGKTLFYSRLLEGNYPDTTRLIPKESDTTVTFNATELLSAINRASLLSHESRNNVVKLEINPSGAKITGNSPDVGQVEEALNVKAQAGNELAISFNPDYMKDALRSFGNIDIEVSFTTALRPFTLIPVENGESFIQLITPVRTF
ncbi:DNA polymerase III subunit beta [Periweissella ghanensis]|uniref:Beta sliding clamp n=1 Tax=Periweissella ghanensis TaxID=467997 RepID=A0ABM8Z8V3_9LACO|nr:DNA polymerase III subunit beta [Periweissella ghanensis]MCM0601052.1 DNA polymerase III subunit beta [Periweissella ghanensis]CAH0417867.1 Beta sliding clamp [Periweissella ghanensis]